MKTSITFALLFLSLTLVMVAQQPPAPSAQSPLTQTVSEITELRISNAYQKVLLAQENLNSTIQAFNLAVAQGRETEKLPAEFTLQFDPQTSKVRVILMPPQPKSLPAANAPAPPQPAPASAPPKRDSPAK